MIKNLLIKFTEQFKNDLNSVTAFSIFLATIFLGFDRYLITFIGEMHLYQNRDQLYAMERIIPVMGFVFGSLAATIILMRYLRGDIKFLNGNTQDIHSRNDLISREDINMRFANIEVSLKALQDSITNKVAPVARESVLELHDTLAERFSTTLPDAVRQKITENILRITSIERTQELLEQARSRLAGEIGALGRRGNLNLIIGSLTTSAAVYLLYQAATTMPPKGEDYIYLLTFYIPRIALATFVEVFSFYFLRLYRNGLTDLKYYHGELLDLDLKIAVLETACREGDSHVIAKVVTSFADTARTTKKIDDKGEDVTSVDPKLIAELVETAIKLGKVSNK